MNTWHLENPEAASANWKSYYAKNKEELKAVQKQKYRKDPLRYLIYAAKDRAKKLGIQFDLKYEDVVMPDVCPIFGTPFEVGNKTTGASLDRIIPELGYTRGNVAVISFRANRIKNNATADELERVAAWMRSVQN
jgi:hypothetical protein